MYHVSQTINSNSNAGQPQDNDVTMPTSPQCGTCRGQEALTILVVEGHIQAERAVVAFQLAERQVHRLFAVAAACGKRVSLFLSFPYVCPEPVLVK